MRRRRSVLFDMGLAGVGCFLFAYPAYVLWLFVEEDAWLGWSILTGFAVSYAFVRLVDRVAARVETGMAALRRYLS
ncbi:unnamed protein product [Gemmata massiliana]|uniref:Uncharacterized protein n=1 Tax=Gemmata massiliana TaxID=1210884 RepID=A0A6P2CWW6_9BACT|nr:hypothetical protein [Gemmata massiliana]VTR93393.1 unnamed protein product [Gemmata massiliana]